METDSNLTLVRSLMRAARQTTPFGAQYFCDAAVLSSAGIPSVIFGPGDISQAHTADEWIALNSLARGASILERFLRSLP
jgi:acetylornithine deacetylase